MSKLPRWPWAKTPPGSVVSEFDDVDHQARLEDAEHELQLAQQQSAQAWKQVGEANRFLAWIGPVIKENHIGPSVERSFSKGKKK